MLHRSRWRALLAVMATISVVGLSLGLTLPLISLVLEAQGYSSALIGLAAAMPALGILLGSPFTPWLVRHHGARQVMITGLLVNIATILPMAWVESYPLWLLLRFLMGAADALLFTVCETWVNQLAEERSRGRLIAVYITLLSSFFASGPLLIGLTGSQGELPFLVACALMMLALPPMIMVGSGSLLVGGSRPSGFSVWGFCRLVPGLAFGVLVFAAIDSSAMALLPLLGLRIGYSEALAAAMITIMIIGNIFLQLPLGWLADRVDRRRLLMGCSLGLILGGLGVLAWSSTWMLWPMLVVVGSAAGGVYNLSMVLVGQRFRDAELVIANAAFGVLWGLGTLLGPSLAGVLMYWVQPGGLALTWVVLAGLLLLLLGVEYQQNRCCK
jgi:MFS family permease